jgi:hypothetical protein
LHATATGSSLTRARDPAAAAQDDDAAAHNTPRAEVPPVIDLTGAVRGVARGDARCMGP